MNIFKSIFSRKRHETPSTEDLTASLLNSTQMMLDASQR